MKSFYNRGEEIRKYCLKHLIDDDFLYRIFYYDTSPLSKKGHAPISKKMIDFSKTPVAQAQDELFKSIKNTPNFALRSGQTVWRNNEWVLYGRKLKDLLNNRITAETLQDSDFQPLIQQKAVDMKIGIDIALIAMKKIAEKLIIITGDADIVPALKLARREGMQVTLDSLGCPIKPELREHVDFLRTFSAKCNQS